MNLSKETIREMVAEVLELDAKEIKNDSLFFEFIKDDSLRILELLSILEKKMRIRIPDNKISDMISIDGIYNTIINLKN